MVGITPTVLISFFSTCYGGRASDKFITRDAGLYDDKMMPDRGFQIQEDFFIFLGCLCHLVQDFFLKSNDQIEIWKLKIKIEIVIAINRIKCFRILKGTIPVTMIQQVDSSVLTFVAIV